jgi:hypothetical protein
MCRKGECAEYRSKINMGFRTWAPRRCYRRAVPHGDEYTTHVTKCTAIVITNQRAPSSPQSHGDMTAQPPSGCRGVGDRGRAGLSGENRPLCIASTGPRQYCVNLSEVALSPAARPSQEPPSGPLSFLQHLKSAGLGPLRPHGEREAGSSPPPLVQPFAAARMLPPEAAVGRHVARTM